MIGTRQQNIPINGHETTQEINIRYENRFLLMSLAIAGLALGRCTASAHGGDREANQDITVFEMELPALSDHWLNLHGASRPIASET
jgi:hypothetical protein